MSLTTDIDSTYISSSNNAKQSHSFNQQPQQQHHSSSKQQNSKKFETDSSLVDTTLKQQSAAPDSGLSSAKTENLKQSASNLTNTANKTTKKLPLKITQDDNRLTINLESSRAAASNKYESSNTTRRQNTTTSEQPVTLTQQAPKTKLPSSSSSLARHIRAPHFKSSYRSKSDQAKSKRDTSQSSNNENLIRIIKENIEPINQLQPCDLFLLPLLQLSDYGTDYLKLKATTTTTTTNNDLLLANLVKNAATTTTSVANKRTSTLITTTTTTTKQTTTTTEQEEVSIHQSNLQHSTSFLAEFANIFQQTKNKMVNSTKKENKKTGNNNNNNNTHNTNRNLKELIGEAGDLSPLFMPIVQLAEIDLERKKTNRLMNTFKQVTESYRRNRKLSKEPPPVPHKQADLIIDKSKSLVNLNQVLNQSIATSNHSGNNNNANGVPTVPVTAPLKKKLNNFLKTTISSNNNNNNSNFISGPNAPDPPPRTHSIPGYSTTRLGNEDTNNLDENNSTTGKDLDLVNKQHALLATRLTFSTETTNTSMDLNNSDVYVNKFSNQSWVINFFLFSFFGIVE